MTDQWHLEGGKKAQQLHFFELPLHPFSGFLKIGLIQI